MMKKFFYQAKFSSQLLGHVLVNAIDFDNRMRTSVEAFGGKLTNCFLLAESTEPIGFVEFEEDVQARAWAAFYGTQDGVISSTIRRLLSTSDLTEMHRLIEKSEAAAKAHRTL